MNSSNSERVQRIATVIVLVAFGLVVAGTVFIPALLAYILCWKWVFAYPVLFVAALLAASCSKKDQ